MEKWRSIKGYKGYYEVSNRGRIKSLKRTITFVDGRTRRIPERFLKLTLTRNNLGKPAYFVVALCKEHIETQHLVHRLVATAFIPNPESKSDVNHKDGNKQNNRKSNLEWMTKQENEEHAKAIGLKAWGFRNTKCVISQEDIPSILRRVKKGRIGIQVKIAKEYGVTPCAINDIVKGRRKVKVFIGPSEYAAHRKRG